MIKKTKFIFLILFLSNTPSVFSQVSELHFDDLTNCIPNKLKDTINSIELSYRDGVVLYNEASNNLLADKEKLEKLTSLFKIQLVAKSKLQEIWEQSDSTSRSNSSKYFTEASTAYKGLTDTINITNPSFKSVKSALIAVEKSHQVIILQKFGLQVLLGCVRESDSKIGQPKDIPGILINIDMIERFRKVWNEANSPMTYDQWMYKPTERKIFSAQTLVDSYKDRFKEKKTDAELNVASQDISTQSALAINTSVSQDSKIELSKDNLSSNAKSDNMTHRDITKISATARSKDEWIDKEKKQGFPIKGESNQLAINQNTQFEVKSLISPQKIKTFGVDYFTIQIAASKNRLVKDVLKKELYCSKFEIEEKNEDGWFKYLVGQFTSIDSAIKFLARPCFTRGFVSGYNTKGRVAIFSIKQPVVESFDTSNYSIVYRVQIAASKQPLSNETIASIYKGYNPVNVSQEDGWYRYSIGDFIYYGEAKITRDSCGTKDAFVMPYHHQKRIHWPSKNAMELLKIKQNDNPIYVVQVAASREPLSIQIVHNIIKVDYPLTMKFEDGWYKYYISAFTNFAVAKEVAVKIGIKGAFIATYKNGLRVKP